MLPPTILQSPALLAQLSPTGVFPRRVGLRLEWVALKDGKPVCKSETSYERAYKRLDKAGGVRRENTEHLELYLGE